MNKRDRERLQILIDQQQADMINFLKENGVDEETLHFLSKKT